MDKEKEKEKEKEIEELRQVVAEYSCNRRCTESCEKRGYCSVKRFVTNIIDAGYRKIPEDAIVLTREEQECATSEEVIAFFVKHNAEVRKETAKDILTEISKLYGLFLGAFYKKYGVEGDE